MVKKVIVLALSVLCLLAMPRCRRTPSPTLVPVSLEGRITFAGSTTVQPLAAEIGKAFNARYPDITLDIAAGGSSVGINAIHEGTVDIGMASRALKDEEAAGITVHPIAVDVLAIVVHTDNPVEDLSTAQLQDIYLGKNNNWQAVGGPDAPITVVVREKTSGTRGAFDEIVLHKADPAAPHLQVAITAGDVAALVAKEPYAIGYIGFGNLDARTKPLRIDGVSPTEKNVHNGRYRLTRPLLLLTGSLTQPIAQLYIDFALSPDGQQIVADHGWMPVQ